MCESQIHTNVQQGSTNITAHPCSQRDSFLFIVLPYLPLLPLPQTFPGVLSIIKNKYQKACFTTISRGGGIFFAKGTGDVDYGQYCFFIFSSPIYITEIFKKKILFPPFFPFSHSNIHAFLISQFLQDTKLSESYPGNHKL